MTHLIKLCVGAKSLAELQAWQTLRLEQKRLKKEEEILWHTTRLRPQKYQEIIKNGSLYWVINGYITARQKIIDFRPCIENSTTKWNICLAPETIPVILTPRSPFQGWRYLKNNDTPKDILNGEDVLLNEIQKFGVI